jgi:hypothetical protein
MRRIVVDDLAHPSQRLASFAGGFDRLQPALQVDHQIGIIVLPVAGQRIAEIGAAGGSYVALPQADIGLADPFRPDLARLVNEIMRRRIESLILVPEYLAALVEALELSGARLPSLAVVAVGGAPIFSGPPAPIAAADARAADLRSRPAHGSCAPAARIRNAFPGSLP